MVFPLTRSKLASGLWILLWATIFSFEVTALAIRQAPGPADITSNKFVIAHFIVGNTFPYTIDDWKRAITLAASKNIDAFALDMGVDSCQPERVSDAYKAATGTSFKLFLSFDMGSLPCFTPSDGDLLRQLIQGYSGHGNPALRPGIFMEPPIFPNLNSIDGAFSWDSAWPMSNRAIDSSYDDEYLTYLPGRTYMAGVSPWFFTHYSEKTYNKNLLYHSDDSLYISRWENLIAYRNVIDLVQIISWNDYGESHYIGPIDGAQPMSESWTTGFDHQGWLDVTQYYATAFKTGVYPTREKDRVFLWGRLYPAGANAPEDVGKPLNSEYTDDYIWGLVFLTSPAHVDLGCDVYHEAVELPAGANKVKLSLLGVDDCAVTTTISRNGRSVLDFRPEQYRFRKNPPTYNFNALVISSPP